ncbi:aromatic amino acid ammonia-lyase [Schnuerera sp. xch1]|uniref:HAL/PAL/TAL family ammonia-lyase n=1 Tax=Schnuerera sp. xch1 TaxID=2874283 RepID=UPI001CBC69B8|nr:aromatic amino acid ammonia-lyase [Schnuerera sp. xch1]MBZ2175172.1 aromatic amino acid ammonia-lyase [Schnuerera sp. xch1]
MEKLVLTGKGLILNDIYDVAFNYREVEIDEEALELAKHARQILFDLAAKGEPVYGLNRGVGWNKDKEFDQDFFEEYNRNLLSSHCLGVEPYNTDEEVRAMLLIRLNKALAGSTGISTEILDLYKEFLNRRIHPHVPRRGSIGEGDITTLSHIGLCLIGEWEVSYKGKIVPTIEALNEEGIKPVVLGPKDGLSIVSSNAQGEAMVAILIKEVEDLISISNLIYCLSLEGLNGVIQSLDEKVNTLRGLNGQAVSAKQCREFLEGSYLYKPHKDRALQDPLSFRCAFAVSGTVIDALNFVKEYLQVQINATDDNPCIVYDEDRISVSCNFETTTLAVGVEMLGIALNHISSAACHRIIKLSDPGFTGLSRFLTPKEIKTIAYGTIQKAFTYLDAENRMLANPSSMDYYSLAGQIEDHASNLPLVAAKVAKIVDNIRYIIGMEAIHAAQAIDLRGDIELGNTTKLAYEEFRKSVPFLDKDRNLSVDIKKAHKFICSNELKDIISHNFGLSESISN